MRMLLKITIDTEKGNQLAAEDRVGEVVEKNIGSLSPEAVYMVTLDGKRTVFVFFDLERESQLPQICEPLFQELGADLELTPAMTPADLAAGLGDS